MIHIVLDANQLYISYEKCNELDVYNHFLVNKNLNDLLKIRDHSNCIDDILVLVPEIVIQELIQQKYEQNIGACHHEQFVNNCSRILTVVLFDVIIRILGYLIKLANLLMDISGSIIKTRDIGLSWG